MNVRCNCGHYYNTDVYNNVCPECDQRYFDKIDKVETENQYVNIEKHVEKLIKLGQFYKKGKQ